jgi:hypothetical protein
VCGLVNFVIMSSICYCILLMFLYEGLLEIIGARTAVKQTEAMRSRKLLSGSVCSLSTAFHHQMALVVKNYHAIV